MTRTEMGGVFGLVVAVATGIYAFGVLRGQVDALNPGSIREAQEKALAAIDAKLESPEFSSDTATFRWRSDRDDGQPVRMIPVTEGICYLTMVDGSFQDLEGDVARVYVLGGYWYLGGETASYGTGAGAMCWRFPERS